MPSQFEDWLAQDKFCKLGYIQLNDLVSEYVLCSVYIFGMIFLNVSGILVLKFALIVGVVTTQDIPS